MKKNLVPRLSASYCKLPCECFKYLLISNNTKQNVEIKFWGSYKTLESTGETKLMIKFYLCFYNFSELWHLFLKILWKIVFGFISGNQCMTYSTYFLCLLWESRDALSLAAVTASLRVAKTHLLHLSFYSSSPCHFRPSSGPLPFWCPG